MIYLQWLFEMTKAWYKTLLGVQVGASPAVNAGTAARTPQRGSYFWKLQAISANGSTGAVIASAKDRNGTTVSGLATITLNNAQVLEFPLSEYTLTSGTVIEYQAPAVFVTEN